ncbi:MAG: hypothetical protein Q9217_000487 [Psora testacea]
MDDQVVEEDPYTDDDLDALPDDAFHELEENAVRSTQQRANAAPARLSTFRSSHRPADNTLAGGFKRLSLTPETGFGQARNGKHQPSSDYGDFDDEMLDGEIFDGAMQPSLAVVMQQDSCLRHTFGEPTQKEPWRQQRYGQPRPNVVYQGQQKTQGYPTASALPNLTNADSGVNEQDRRPVSGKDTSIPTQVASGSSNVDALQAQVKKLLRDREQLQQAIQDANDNAYAKAGEIAIVRANASKIEKEYEDRTKLMQRLHADEAARQKMEVEKARAELQKIATEKDFLANDLAEGTKQIRSLQKAIKRGDKPSEAGAVGKENVATTPRRRKAGLGDGFDDVEIQPLSPSKLVFRGKAGTPKAGSKRKRKATEENPMQQPLEIAEPVHVESFDEPAPAPAKTVAVSPQPSKPRDQKFQFAQRFLNHRIRHGEERTIEALAKYKFPSPPDLPLSTILLDKMSPLNIRPNVKNLPSAIALEVISIWSQCIQEKYHEPVHLLIDLVKYILITTFLKTAPDLTNSLMSLLQETADILIVPRCQKKPPSNRALISSTECLETMHLMASQLSISRDDSTRFWRTMRFDFIMMLLSFIHPLEELNLTIRILHTSILPNSFAMIIPPGDGKQDATEARVIDNLSRLLVEPPRPSQEEPALSSIELAQLRLSILELLEEMGANDYAALTLCKHRLLLGRLVRLMNDSLAHAYSYTNAHPHLIALVNNATRLLYYLLTNYTEQINMQQKLSVIPGGEKKFLIVLTRLAFSEGGILEGGIEDDVVELAHRMLEERVSPEEAEGLVEAMSSAPRNKVATGRGASRDEGDSEPEG